MIGCPPDWEQRRDSVDAAFFRLISQQEFSGVQAHRRGEFNSITVGFSFGNGADVSPDPTSSSLIRR